MVEFDIRSKYLALDYAIEHDHAINGHVLIESMLYAIERPFDDDLRGRIIGHLTSTPLNPARRKVGQVAAGLALADEVRSADTAGVQPRFLQYLMAFLSGRPLQKRGGRKVMGAEAKKLRLDNWARSLFRDFSAAIAAGESTTLPDYEPLKVVDEWTHLPPKEHALMLTHAHLVALGLYPPSHRTLRNRIVEQR